MQKELIISTTAQETKLAILEDDELVEFYIERHRSHGIVGNIYKGRVTKVLPGMQSAFVDIGLERDAFLYVSDFLDDTEEYDKIVSTAEDEVAQLQDAPAARPPAPSGAVSVAITSAVASPPPVPAPAAIPAPRLSPPPPSMTAPPSSAPLLPAPPSPSPAVPAPEAAPRTEALPRTEPVSKQAATVSAREPVPAPVIPPATLSAPQPGPAPESKEGARNRERDRGRDRDRRGKKLRIPSFENRIEESRVEPEVYGTIEALPGESLARHRHPAPERSQRPARAPEPMRQPASDRASGPMPEPTAPVSELSKPSALSGPPELSTPMDAPEQPQEKDAATRISDRSPDSLFAHRPSGRRPRRRPGEGSDAPNGSAPAGPNAPKPEEPRGAGPAAKPAVTIADLLREGQEILVQISKEPLGKKGARITSHIALPGRYVVYMPTVDHVGVSRKIASDEERSRLKRIINENRNGLPGGVIVRTAASGRGEEEFVQDLRFLGNLWTDIRSKSEKRSGPALIHSDLNLVQRILRDQLSRDFTAIRIDSEQEFATILDFVNKFQPALVNRVKLHIKDTPIFEEFGLNTEVDKALRSKVWLKSGGYIVINQTEALVAIDVNTGKYVGKSNRLEDTIARTNLDAVHEIVRQIRLRNLGGIIVVDFIDMEERKNRQRVMTALEDELRSDKVPSKILQFNDFGLVAITRKRTQPSLERTICAPCGHCNGTGWSKSPETICYEIQQELKKMSGMLESREVTIRVSLEVAKALKSGEFISINDMEESFRKDIIVKSDPLLHDENFDIF